MAALDPNPSPKAFWARSILADCGATYGVGIEALHSSVVSSQLTKPMHFNETLDGLSTPGPSYTSDVINPHSFRLILFSFKRGNTPKTHRIPTETPKASTRLILNPRVRRLLAILMYLQCNGALDMVITQRRVLRAQGFEVPQTFKLTGPIYLSSGGRALH